MALAKGRELDLQPLSVAVLDSGGHLKAFGREDGSGIPRPQICFGKAYAALGLALP
ncbi:MAG: heme-binding protein [Acidobacteriota bacterium]|nr:heme-binding protein [Acidobacteriota bacterium]